MTGRLEAEVKQRQSMPLEEETYGNLLRTSALLLAREAAVLEPFSLTPTQHNILRILRGARPDGLRVGAVMERLVTPSPDGTRLLDRLEGKGLVRRDPDPEDGRAVLNRITAEGLALLERADRALTRMLEGALREVPREQMRSAIAFLEAVRANLVALPSGESAA